MSKTMSERLKEDLERMTKKPVFKAKTEYIKMPQAAEAEVRIRILPAKNYYLDGEKNPQSDFFYGRFGQHWIGKNKIICPTATMGDECPICQRVAELRKSSDPTLVEWAKSNSVRRRGIVNCVEVDNDNNIISGVKVYEFPQKLLTTMLTYCTDEDYADLSSPEDGYTFRVIKATGVNGIINYDASKPTKKQTSVDKDLMISLLEQATDINEKIKHQMLPFDEILAILEGREPEPKDDDVPSAASESVSQEDLLASLNDNLKKKKSK